MKKFRVPVTHHETGEFNRFLYETLENGIFMFNECMRDFPRELVIGNEEQFIGLHDKNGKEIYEGDILKEPVLLSEKGETINSQVIWSNGRFIANGTIGARSSANSEIIGNIHENPEILND